MAFVLLIKREEKKRNRRDNRLFEIIEVQLQDTVFLCDFLYFNVRAWFYAKYRGNDG